MKIDPPQLHSLRKTPESSPRLRYLRQLSDAVADEPLIAIHFDPETVEKGALETDLDESGYECGHRKPPSPPSELDAAVFAPSSKVPMTEVLDFFLKKDGVLHAGPVISLDPDDSAALRDDAGGTENEKAGSEAGESGSEKAKDGSEKAKDGSENADAGSESGKNGSEDRPSIITYLTQEMVIVIREPADVDAVFDRAEALGYRRLRRIPYGEPRTYHLRADSHPGLAVLDHAEELSAIEGVVAEPNLASTSELDGPAISGSLPSDHWDRFEIGAGDAWSDLPPEASVTNIDLAIVDGSFHTEDPAEIDTALSSHELLDMRTLRKRKKTLPGPFDGSAPGHGLRAAGVAAANSEKLKGVAPGCHTRLVVFPVTEIDVLDMYVWLAGLDPQSPRRGFPKPRAAADVVSTSVGFGFARRMPISVVAAYAFDFIAQKGRDEKGTLLFFSAGNSGRCAYIERPWSTAAENFGIAASTRDSSSAECRLASYSNHHGVELCAPSSSALGTNVGKDGRGVKSIGKRMFGGTSSATPLAAGVAALVLAARPDSSHRDVRDILRTSAKRIDTDAVDEKTLWRNAENLPAARPEERIYSHAYGFGQVQAADAVKTALVYEPPAEDGPGTHSPESSSPETSSPGTVRAGGGQANIRKAKTAPIARSGGDSAVGTASLILAAFHGFLALLLALWPHADIAGLAGVAALLAAYHLVIWAVLRVRRRRSPSNPDERDDLMADPPSGPTSIPPY